MINYFTKYNLSRNIKSQKRAILSQYKTDERFLEGYRKEIERYSEKLEIAKIQENQEEIEKYQTLLKRDNEKVLNLQKEILKIEKFMPIDPEKEDSQTDEEISSLYFSIKMNNIFSHMKDEYENIKNMPESKEKRMKSVEFRDRINEFLKARTILENPKYRRKYLLDLEKQEYLEYLESNRKIRIAEEEKNVKKLLGEDFNPDMSSGKNEKGTYSWNVRLYDKPQELFVGKSNFPETPQLNQEIYAYRYGSFEIGAMNRKNGRPLYVDSLCEVIGVTKKAADGTEKTHFVIAPLRYVSNFKNYPHKISLNERPKILEEDEKQDFANLYLSDYLLENAAQNNANYLGEFSFKDGKTDIKYDVLSDEHRIGACFYSKNNAGNVYRKVGQETYKIEVENMDALFRNLQTQQVRLVKNSKIKLAKRDVSEEIK